MVFVTNQGQVLYAMMDDIPLQGRVSGGVHGIKLDDDDFVVYADQIDDVGEIAIVTDGGMAKRVIVPKLDLMARYRKGVKIISLSKGDSVKFAVACTTALNLVFDTADGVLSKSTDKIAIEDRVSKGKSFVKTKDNFEVYINNTK